MPGYRHYRLDGAGNIVSADWLDAVDDAEAIRKARSLQLLTDCELWDRNRFIARIEAAERE